MEYSKKLKKPRSGDGSNREGLIVVGVDPSIRGTGLAIVKDGALVNSFAWTEVKALQKKHSDRLVWYQNPKHATPSDIFLRKLMVIEWVMTIVRALDHVDVVAIEDYAFSKSARSVSDLHELGGQLKKDLWLEGIPFRTYDPLTIKLAWAGDGFATKDDMVEACLEAFDVDYSPFVQEVKRKKKLKRPPKQLGRGPGYDMADATCIAFLAYWELLVKLGRCTLKDLDSDLRRVMLRVTKANPEAIATRPLISHRDTSDRREPAPIFASGEPR